MYVIHPILFSINFDLYTHDIDLHKVREISLKYQIKRLLNCSKNLPSKCSDTINKSGTNTDAIQKKMINSPETWSPKYKSCKLQYIFKQRFKFSDENSNWEHLAIWALLWMLNWTCVVYQCKRNSRKWKYGLNNWSLK